MRLSAAWRNAVHCACSRMVMTVMARCLYTTLTTFSPKFVRHSMQHQSMEALEVEDNLEQPHSGRVR